MESLAESMSSQAPVPRFEDELIKPRELIRHLAENVVSVIMHAETDQPCTGDTNSRNGYREHNLVTCVGDITMRIPKLRSGSFFPEDIIGRHWHIEGPGHSQKPIGKVREFSRSCAVVLTFTSQLAQQVSSRHHRID